MNTCIFCYGGLGSNAVIESFPVGTRIAFDPGNGRLWAVCPGCGRWNLSPLEERFEWIEEAERTFRGACLRGCTDNISLARTPDGTDLIRIGPALRREIAAWRYGDRFIRRYWKSLGFAAVIGGPLPLALLSGNMMALAAIPGGSLLLLLPQHVSHRMARRKVIARIPQPDGRTAVVRGKHVEHARLLGHPVDGWTLSVKHEHGRDQLRGAEAVHIAAPILTRLNEEGARRKTVDRALEVLDAFPAVDQIFQHFAQSSYRNRGNRPLHTLAHNSTADLLALEMAAHDQIERYALEGELAYLERAWKEAEAIAAIADDLLLPASVLERLRSLKPAVASQPR